MRYSQGPIDNSFLDTLDLRAFVETVRLRWWLVPAFVVASVGFLQIQESGLRTEPASFVVSRAFEVATPEAMLNAIGVRLSIPEFPEPNSQTLILQSDEIRDEINRDLGKDIEVQVPQNWEAPITFTCNEPIVTDCERAIAAYVKKAEQIRADAISFSIQKMISSLTPLAVIEPSSNLATPPNSLSGDRTEVSATVKLAALKGLQDNLNFPFIQVGGFEQEIGTTVNQFQRSTYVLGAAAGVFLSLLVLLQLTFSDSRIRSIRQLSKIASEKAVLGQMTPKSNPIADRRVAVSLFRSVGAHSATTIRYVPLRHSLHNEPILSRLTSMVGVKSAYSEPLQDLDVHELCDSSSDVIDVLIVSRNRDLRRDVHDGLLSLQQSGRQLGGILLIR